MTIIFKVREYELKDSVDVSEDKLQATLVRGNTQVNDLLDEIKHIKKITIKDEAKVVKTYDKYTRPLAVVVYDDEDIISVELLNETLLQK